MYTAWQYSVGKMQLKGFSYVSCFRRCGDNHDFRTVYRWFYLTKEKRELVFSKHVFSFFQIKEFAAGKAIWFEDNSSRKWRDRAWAGIRDDQPAGQDQ